MTELDKDHMKVLRYIYRHPFTEFSKIEKRYKKLPVNKIGANLLRFDLIICTVANSLVDDEDKKHYHSYESKAKVFSRLKGNVVVEKYYERLLTFFLPLSISAIALVLSFISVLK